MPRPTAWTGIDRTGALRTEQIETQNARDTSLARKRAPDGPALSTIDKGMSARSTIEAMKNPDKRVNAWSKPPTTPRSPCDNRFSQDLRHKSGAISIQPSVYLCWGCPPDFSRTLRLRGASRALPFAGSFVARLYTSCCALPLSAVVARTSPLENGRMGADCRPGSGSHRHKGVGA